ncbi:MAG TPA: uridine diphosphate-N-acetylglucosamine-binding protein YvcK [Acidimicrobiales bacterium]|jgi:uncharacterized cofD-like protein|nr:uridine diphosphate-N-acetylglucosamine-binding protein YvcK [Acidimicrobiales bacterium]
MSGPAGQGGQPRVAAVGGGHGLAATLSAVRRYTDAVTAVVSVADDGGSSGRLRELLGVMPPGDLRKCMVAMAEPGSILAIAFARRFGEEELTGHSLGNLVLAGLIDAAEDPIAGIDEACRLLGVKGRILPATTDPVVLKADADGGPVAGQVAVMGTGGIRHISLVPEDPEAPAAAVDALLDADQIILGPGSLFTSTLAAAVVPGIRNAIQRSSATTVYVCNLRPELPETADFDVAMHLEALAGHGIEVDVAVCDPTRIPFGKSICRIVEAPLARSNGRAHDPVKLAAALVGLVG